MYIEFYVVQSEFIYGMSDTMRENEYGRDQVRLLVHALIPSNTNLDKSIVYANGQNVLKLGKIKYQINQYIFFKQ